MNFEGEERRNENNFALKTNTQAAASVIFGMCAEQVINL